MHKGASCMPSSDIEEDRRRVILHDWVAITYETECFPRCITSVKDDMLQVDFLHHTNMPGLFKWPTIANIDNVDRKFVFKLLPDAPDPVSRGGCFFPIGSHSELEFLFTEYQKKYFQ